MLQNWAFLWTNVVRGWIWSEGPGWLRWLYLWVLALSCWEVSVVPPLCLRTARVTCLLAPCQTHSQSPASQSPPETTALHITHCWWMTATHVKWIFVWLQHTWSGYLYDYNTHEVDICMTTTHMKWIFVWLQHTWSGYLYDYNTHEVDFCMTATHMKWIFEWLQHKWSGFLYDCNTHEVDFSIFLLHRSWGLKWYLICLNIFHRLLVIVKTDVNFRNVLII